MKKTSVNKNKTVNGWGLVFSLAVSVILCANLGVAYGAPVETITVRSGQVGCAPGPCPPGPCVPGLPGAADAIVTFNPTVSPPCSPLLLPSSLSSPFTFTAADFAAATVGGGGLPATVISPHPAWFPGLPCDPLARWIDFGLLPGGTLGAPGSALFAVPFCVKSTTVTCANICLCGGADDVLGDLLFGGPNPAGIYINGIPSIPSATCSAFFDFTCFNFGVPSTHCQDITALINPGLNYLYFYVRDAGCAVSGLIFSATITVNCCVLTQGYWKNHPAMWPVGSLTLGTVSYNQAQLLAILGQPVQGNGLVSLAHQLIAALLNQANGAPTPATVQTAINNATALIGGLVVPPIGTGYLQPSQTSSLINTLAIYNNGLLPGGPPHCE